MLKNSTRNLLVKHLYNETSIVERFEIEEAITQDGELKKLYKTLSTSKKVLPQVTFSPSAKSIENILKYSRSTSLEKQS